MNDIGLRFRDQIKVGARNELLDQLLTNGRVIEPAVGSLPRRPLSSRELATRDFTHEWLIEGLLVKGQPGIIGGPEKSMKTSLSVDLLISLASETSFLGRFPVLKPRRVCLYSGESGMTTLKETALRICKSKKIDLEPLSAYWDSRLPALNSEKDRERLSKMIERGKLEVVIFDPLYLSLLAASAGKAVNPANLYEMGPLLQTISQTCLRSGATPLFIHHTKKMGGNRAERKPKHAPIQLGDLSYSGVQEFARQWMLVNRRDEYVPGTGYHELWMSVGGSAGFSDCWAVDINEGLVRHDFTGRGWKVTIRSQSEERQEGVVRKALDMQQQDRTKVLTHLQQADEPLTQTAIREATGLSTARVKKAIESLVNDHQISMARVQKAFGSSTKEVDAYAIGCPATSSE